MSAITNFESKALSAPQKLSQSTGLSVEILNFVHGVKDTKETFGKDSWKPPVSDPEVPPSFIKLLKATFSAYKDKVFRFRLTRVAALTTSGGGSMALSTYNYPSQFDQYSSLSALFEECKQVSVRAQLVSLFPDTPTSTYNQGTSFAINFEPSAYNSTPSITTSTVCRIPGTKLITNCQRNWPVKLTHTYKNKVWCGTGSTGFGQDPSGITGRFNWVALNAVGATQTVFEYLIEAEYDFRGLS